MKQAATRKRTTTEVNGVEAAGKFGGYLFDIGWRLAASVIIFLAGGNWLDNKFGTKPWFAATGFILVIASFVLIVRQILQKIPKSLGGLKDDK